MLYRSSDRKQVRKGQSLVEYALLITGVALTSVVAVALLGHKASDVVGVMASVLPSAHADDNKPIQSGQLIPIDGSGSTISLDTAGLVSSGGVDRMSSVLGPGGGESLVVD